MGMLKVLGIRRCLLWARGWGNSDWDCGIGCGCNCGGCWVALQASVVCTTGCLHLCILPPAASPCAVESLPVFRPTCFCSISCSLRGFLGSVCCRWWCCCCCCFFPLTFWLITMASVPCASAAGSSPSPILSSNPSSFCTSTPSSSLAGTTSTNETNWGQDHFCCNSNPTLQFPWTLFFCLQIAKHHRIQTERMEPFWTLKLYHFPHLTSPSIPSSCHLCPPFCSSEAVRKQTRMTYLWDSR